MKKRRHLIRKLRNDLNASDMLTVIAVNGFGGRNQESTAASKFSPLSRKSPGGKNSRGIVASMETRLFPVPSIVAIPTGVPLEFLSGDELPDRRQHIERHASTAEIEFTILNRSGRH